MNPFEKLGRSAQRLKHKAVGPSDADVVFVCKNCEAQFTEQSNECPECDSTDIVAVEP
jgi:Zn finger protein HypA/HybF involved in hydrogenase expression